MESDNEKDEDIPKENSVSRPEINISHEDLSDVSDLEDCIGDNSDEDQQDHKDEDSVLRENSNNHLSGKKKSISPEPKKVFYAFVNHKCRYKSVAICNNAFPRFFGLTKKEPHLCHSCLLPLFSFNK